MDLGITQLSQEFCFSCLNYNKGTILNQYNADINEIKNTFQVKTLTLCVICSKIAENASKFIQNIIETQKLLLNVETITDETLKSLQNKRSPMCLSMTEAVNINITEVAVTESGVEDYEIIRSSNLRNTYEVKTELYKEDDDDPMDFDDEHENTSFDLKDDIQETTIKKESHSKVLHKTKKKVSKKSSDKSRTKERNKRKKTVRASSKKCIRNDAEPTLLDVKNEDLSTIIKLEHDNDVDINIDNNVSSSGVFSSLENEHYKIETIKISEEECMKEREILSQDPKYLSMPLKCEKCIKGFTFNTSYEKHMERHSNSFGKYICNICHLRKETKEKLNNHKKYHEIRYVCTVCELRRVSKRALIDHYLVSHCEGLVPQTCPYCSKIFDRLFSLRKHITYAHTQKAERVICHYCQKSYINKDVLKAHLMRVHSSGEEPKKKHFCQQCGKGFDAPSHLKKHLLKHTDKKEFYCVECDKSFKSDCILKHHLKTAAPHVTYMGLRYPCELCGKRFAIKRDLIRHTNSIHLNVKPFQCDRCDKAYVSKWSLKEHQNLVHDGYKRPLRFPCTMCDKVFDRNQILKSHIRTHTGERPYQCSMCPATFSQSSILMTHNKLIHLKLTRDGRAKRNR